MCHIKSYNKIYSTLEWTSNFLPRTENNIMDHSWTWNPRPCKKDFACRQENIYLVSGAGSECWCWSWWCCWLFGNFITSIESSVWGPCWVDYGKEDFTQHFNGFLGLLWFYTGSTARRRNSGKMIYIHRTNLWQIIKISNIQTYYEITLLAVKAEMKTPTRQMPVMLQRRENIFDDKMFPVVRTKWCYNNPRG